MEKGIDINRRVIALAFALDVFTWAVFDADQSLVITVLGDRTFALGFRNIERYVSAKPARFMTCWREPKTFDSHDLKFGRQ